MTATELMGLSVNPVIKFIQRVRLQARLKTLYAADEYYTAQEKSARAGRAWAHKQIALAESDLRALK